MGESFEDVLIRNNLPKDFGPNHQDWKMPSKRNRYLRAVSGGTIGQPTNKDLLFPARPKTQSPVAHKSGIAVSTHFGPDTPVERLQIFLASIYSLLASEFPGKIVVVDDCSATSTHLLAISAIPGIQIIYRRENGGISKCKNTGINQLAGCEYLFLADDDIIYNGDWWSPYIEASRQSGIGHFSYYEEGWLGVNPQGKLVSHNGADLLQHEHLGGALMFMTRDTINDVGGFRILPKKYGGEHANYTNRCLAAKKMPFFCDVAESINHIRINKSSAEFASISKAVRDEESVNNKYISDVKNIKEPIVE
jgi:glycosyltransferase involved in cell wall biosynthesis